MWLTRFGAPEVLVARPTPDPVPADGQVVVDVEAVSITFVETLVRAGRAPWPGPAPEPPYVPGNGVGGVVSGVGLGVDPEWLGRRVVTGTGGTGAYAERVAVAVGSLVRVPDGLGMLEATAVLADGRTALGLSQLAAITRDDWVLVEAAAGGVGSLLVQLVINAGARVIAAAGGAEKGQRAIGLGATYAVDYDRSDWPDDVRSIVRGSSVSGERGVDVVFDGVGGGVGATALGLVTSGGRFVSFGLASGSPTDTAAASDRGVTVIGFRELGSLGARSAELTASALDLAARGLLKPLIGQTFPLAEAARAHAAIESRATIGKTLLLP